MLPLDLLHCRYYRHLLLVTLKSSVQVEILFKNTKPKTKLALGLFLPTIQAKRQMFSNSTISKTN